MCASIAQQSVVELGGRTSVLHRRRADHARLHRLMGEASASHGDAQQDVLQDICRLVLPHAFAEGSVLWPAARRSLPDGEEPTLRIEQEHQQVNQVVRSSSAGSRRPAPHPVVAGRPPGNVLAALPLSVIDRTRDALDRVVRRRHGRVAAAAELASPRLADLTGHGERLPLLTRGEHPSTHLDPAEEASP